MKLRIYTLCTLTLLVIGLVACGGNEASTEPAAEESATEATVESATEEEMADTDTSTTSDTATTSEVETATTSTFQIDAWSDNWFAAYVGETLIRVVPE